MLIDPRTDTSPLTGQDQLLFEIAPAPIWLQDWTGVAEFRSQMRADGVVDLRAFLSSNRGLLLEAVSRIETFDVNDHAVSFVGASERETTKAVSRNEWKYVAELELDLEEDLPIIEGLPGPLGQSLLIMFVNGAQAIAEYRTGSQNEKGTIRISTPTFR